MKTKGTVNLRRHLIGDRKPIVMFLGIGSVATLTGCDVLEDPYYAFTKIETCNTTLPGQCDSAYKKAEQEAKRTALKYMLENECALDFGDSMCIEQDKAWQPKMAGFMTHKSPKNDFTQPFFTSLNPESRFFGKVFTANGLMFANLTDIDGKNLDLGGDLARPLPTSSVDPSNSALTAAMTAYILSDTLDTRERNRLYRQCINADRDDCYTITSGTSRINTYGARTTPKPATQLETVSKKTYKAAAPVKTKSTGGFGSSGRTFGGFGG